MYRILYTGIYKIYVYFYFIVNSLIDKFILLIKLIVLSIFDMSHYEG